MSRLRLFALRHSARFAGGLVGAWILAIALVVATGSRPRFWWFGSLAVLVLAALLLALWTRWQREVAIRGSTLPQFLKRRLREAYPHLDGRDSDLVERGMRQFFLACLRSNRQFVAMPSRVVDLYWHEFILHTRAYGAWCDLTLGRFLHHTPAEVLGPRARGIDGLRRAWFWSCREESIDPRTPSRLPLLFALDGKLEIADGFRYLPNCADIFRKGAAGGDRSTGSTHCGTSFSDGAYAGDAGGMGGSDSASDGGGHGDGHGGGDGGGDGGDGGGSCGGGGD